MPIGVAAWSRRMRGRSINWLQSSMSVAVSTALDRACRGPARKPVAVPRYPSVHHPSDLANTWHPNCATDHPPTLAGVDQYLGDGEMPAGHRVVGADPLQGGLALRSSDAQRIEIGQLIRLHRVKATDVPLAPVRARRAERAVTIEQQHGALNAHPPTAPTTGCANTRRRSKPGSVGRNPLRSGHNS